VEGTRQLSGTFYKRALILKGINKNASRKKVLYPTQHNYKNKNEK
jgi:hypothetical protein